MSSAHEQSARPATPPADQGSGAGQAAGQYVPRPAPDYDDAAVPGARPSGAVIGWTLFAAIVMMASGVGDFLVGLAAVIRGSFFVQMPNYAFNMSVRGWGWINLVLGIVVFLAGAGLLSGRLWARAVGVALAVCSLIANFIYIPFSPVWSIVVIALDVFVIWALTAPRQRAF